MLADSYGRWHNAAGRWRVGRHVLNVARSEMRTFSGMKGLNDWQNVGAGENWRSESKTAADLRGFAQVLRG